MHCSRWATGGLLALLALLTACAAVHARGAAETSSSISSSSNSSWGSRTALPRRGLAQSPANPALVDALQGIRGDLPGANPTNNGTAANATGSAGNSSSTALGGAAGNCTDPALLITTMTTFCKLGSLDQLASLPQDAVQACCRLTSAALQPNCWDACAPPPAVSPQVMDVLKLWRNICLIASAVTCGEAPGAQPPSG